MGQTWYFDAHITRVRVHERERRNSPCREKRPGLPSHHTPARRRRPRHGSRCSWKSSGGVWWLSRPSENPTRTNGGGGGRQNERVQPQVHGRKQVTPGAEQNEQRLEVQPLDYSASQQSWIKLARAFSRRAPAQQGRKLENKQKTPPFGFRSRVSVNAASQ